MKNLHPSQKRILELSRSKNIGEMSLREIGRQTGIANAPQTVKYHLSQLQKKGYLKSDQSVNYFESVNQLLINSSSFIDVPVLGEANCGVATIFSNHDIMGYLKISTRVIGRNRRDLFAIKAVGDSMNTASIQGESINSGDYVLIDGSVQNYADGDYVLSIIESCANIKRFFRDKNNRRILLKSEAKNQSSFPPIVISESEEYLINGKVMAVISS